MRDVNRRRIGRPSLRPSGIHTLRSGKRTGDVYGADFRKFAGSPCPNGQGACTYPTPLWSVMTATEASGLAYKICPSCPTRVPAEHRYCPHCGSDLSDVEPAKGDPYLGVVLASKYELRELLGEGAMGRVYKAELLALAKPFAIKILHPHLMHDAATHARFASEAQNAASLNHPNCVSVVDYGRTSEGIAYIVMEYIQGITLEQLVDQQHPLARARIVDLTLQILAALGEAHGLKILHRDLKPENILVQSLRTHGELAKVLDFGIAKLMDVAQPERPGLTHQGMVCGTPEYMSPEQARGQKLDARSDLYAVGCILYRLLTGRPPFESASSVEILHRHLHEMPIAPHKLLGQEFDPLEEVCMHALAKDPNDRFASATEFRDAIVRVIGSTPGQGATGQGATVRCSSCGHELTGSDRFCAGCGQPMPTRPGSARRRRSGHSHPAIPLPSTSERVRTAEVIVRNFPLPLVGQDALLAHARALFSKPATQPATVHVEVLSGAPGVGKTRAVQELAMLAESLGWTSFHVGCDPSCARTPLWPIRQMLAFVLELELGTVTTHGLGRAANLHGLPFEELPGLAELFQLAGPAHGVEYQVRKRECFAGAVQTLLHGGRGQPLLLVFDDIDAYDRSSREILRRLARAETHTPVIMMVCSSEPELGWSNVHVNEILPLGHQAVANVCEQVTVGVSPASVLPAKLSSLAPISPFQLEQLLRLLATAGELRSEENDAELSWARVELMPEVARQLLVVGAVLGERFLESDLITLTMGRDGASAELDEALAALHMAGLLLVAGGGERAFAHRVLRQAVYAHIPEPQRRSLHYQAAMLLRGRVGAVAARAMHFRAANAPEAVEALSEAARLATAAFDDSAASDHLEAALRMCQILPASLGRRALEVDLACRLARSMRTAPDAKRALWLLEQQLANPAPPSHEASLRLALGHELARVGRHHDATTEFQRALGLLIPTGDRTAMLAVYGELGQVYARRGDVKRALHELREGLDMCTLGEGPRAVTDLELWRYLLRISDMLRASGDVRQAKIWAEHALRQAELRQTRLGVLRCHAQMAWILRELRQPTLGEQHLARALDHARYFGDRLTTAELLIERARTRAAHGRLADARRCCEDALRLAKIVEWSGGVRHAERALSMLAESPETPSE